MTLRDLAMRIARRWRLMTGVFLIVVLAVGAWTFLAAPRYRSTAVVRIMNQDQQGALANQLTSVPGLDLMGLARDELETEIGVLRSWRIAQAVVDSLALTVRVTEPTGVRSEVLAVEARGDPDREGVLVLRLQPGGGYAATVKEPRAEEQSLGLVVAGGTLEWAGYRLALAGTASDDPPGAIRIEVDRRNVAVEALREDIDIRRQEGGSRLVQVSYTTTDRELAAAVVNGVVGDYVAYKTRTERGEARFTTEELRKKLADYATRLADAEEALRRYQEAHQIVAPEEQATQQVRRLAELQLQVDAVEVERKALGDLLPLIEARASGAPAAMSTEAYRQLATFPTLISNKAIQDLLMVLLDLENERSALLVRRTEENEDVRQLTDRIHELESRLHRVGTEYLEGLDRQLESASATLGHVEGEMEALPGQEMAYTRLLRDRTVLSEAYLLIEKQLNLAEVQDAVRDEGVRVVDYGIVAHRDDPVYPKPLVNLFLGVVLGATLALGAGLVRDLWTV